MTSQSITLPGRPPADTGPVQPSRSGLRRGLSRLWVARGRVAALTAATAILAAVGGYAAFTTLPGMIAPRLGPALAVSAALESEVRKEPEPASVLPSPPPAKPEEPPVEDKPRAETAGSEVSIGRPAPKPDLDALERAVDGAALAVAAAFELRIPAGDGGARSGFWRETGSSRQHFVIVEAVAPDGGPAKWRVTDMDTGETAATSRWAVHITEEEFARMAAEKAIAGGISDLVAGRKVAGVPGIAWKLATSGGALLDWEGNIR